MSGTILLTGTRAPATLDLARRLCHEGFRVVGADSMLFPLGRFSNAFAEHFRVPSPRWDRAGFLREVEAIVERNAVDVIWPTCEEVFYLASTWDRLAAGADLLFPPLETLDRLHHKLRFARWAASLGLEITAPESWEGSEAPEAGELVWKPVYSRFAARTRFEPPKEDRDHWMAQRRVKGKEFCSWAFCRNGVVQVLTQYHCLARSGRGAGCAFAPMWSEAVRQFTETVAHQLGYTGSLAFDFIDENGRIYVLECNPRLTSGLHMLDHGIRLGAILSGVPTDCPPAQRSSQLLWPTLFAAPRIAGSAPDAIFDRIDTGPSWGQGMTLAELQWRALRHRVSILAASTMDIEYNGE